MFFDGQKLLALSARVVVILAAFCIERDQTASEPAAKTDANDTSDPSSSSTFRDTDGVTSVIAVEAGKLMRVHVEGGLDGSVHHHRRLPSVYNDHTALTSHGRLLHSGLLHHRLLLLHARLLHWH